MLVLPRWTVKKAAAYSVGDLPEKDRAEEADWLQCRHCQYSFKVMPGSGEKRGYCWSCQGVTCGKAMCEQHCGGTLHFMRKIEAIEARGRWLASLE